MNQQHYIVTERYSDIRKQAREHLRGMWIPMTISIAFFVIMLGFVPELFSNLLPIGKYTQTLPDGETVTYSTIASLYGAFMQGVFLVGLSSLLLSFCRHKDTSPTHIFDGFEYYVRCFTLSVIKMILVMLWTLLFIIPGIVALYRYYMAEYILAEDPTKGALQCLRESKQMMTFNKMKLFVLQLTFIGWAILAALPFIAATWILKPDPDSIQYLLLQLVCFIPVYALGAYSKVADTVFYEMVSAPYRQKRTEPQIDEVSKWG